MPARRTLAILTLALAFALPLFGCNSQSDGVDHPLNTTAGPPPPPPNKPHPMPNGSGGQKPAGAAPGAGSSAGQGSAK